MISSTVLQGLSIWFQPCLDIATLCISVIVLIVSLYYRYYEIPRDDLILCLIFTLIALLSYAAYAFVHGSAISVASIIIQLACLYILLDELRSSFLCIGKRRHLRRSAKKADKKCLK